jgi:two-component system, OmpR family, alkaline phosphatase synthesis response regulator PhoP
MKRILVIEDNADLAFGLRNNLEIEGYHLEVAETGGAGLAAARAQPTDLIILDLMLPDLDGYRVLREMRESGVHTPVLILTARGEEADKVRGFRLGADDYVTKPFGLLELLARVDALLRRSAVREQTPAPAPAASAGSRAWRFGEIDVDPASRSVRRAGQTVSLTPMEFDLLIALHRRRGAVASRLDLLKEVWGHSAAVLTRTVDTHVAELRRKLEAHPAAPQYIVTVRKAGYRLNLDA